ncbi:hypothetical protein D3C81_1615560 [compost metagenome]
MPAPLGPTSATVCPAGTEKLILCSTSPGEFGYVKETLSYSMLPVGSPAKAGPDASRKRSASGSLPSSSGPSCGWSMRTQRRSAAVSERCMPPSWLASPEKGETSTCIRLTKASREPTVREPSATRKDPTPMQIRKAAEPMSADPAYIPLCSRDSRFS